MSKLSKELYTYCESVDEEKYLAAVLSEGSNRKAATALGANRRTVDRAINRILERAADDGYIEDASPNILFIDIETAPMRSYLWSLWQKHHSTNMVTSYTYMLSWSAKWLGEDMVMSDALCFKEDYVAGDEQDERMVYSVWQLLNEADFVVAHNGDRFDIPKLNTAFLLAGLQPPAPYRQIDTLKIAKRTFGFDSNSLDHLLERIVGRKKADSGGFDTWLGVMQGDMNAWATLIKYNEQDVIDLEELYMKIRAWDKRHPSFATHGGVRNAECCLVCGSENLEETSHTYSTAVSVFPVLTCTDCGAHMRRRQSIVPEEARKNLLVKV